MPNANAEALAAWNEQQLRDGVREDPKGSNDGEPMKRFAMVKEAPASWCSRMQRAGLAHVTNVLSTAEIRDRYEMGAAAYLCAWLLANGGEVVGPDEATRGDLCFISERGASDPLGDGAHDPVSIVAGIERNTSAIHHVGCVVTTSDEKVFTIDGNWNDAVEMQPRGRRDAEIACFVRLP